MILVMGTLLSRRSKVALERFEACVNAGAKVVYLFTMEDAPLSCKSDFFSRYEVGSEEGVMALLAKNLLLHVKLPEALRLYFDTLDDGYLSAESNVGEEEIEEIEALYANAKRVLIDLGDDIVMHPRCHNIIRLAQTIATYGKAQVCVETMPVLEDESLEEVAPLKSFDGTVVYRCMDDGKHEGKLLGSGQFQMAAKVVHNEKVNVSIGKEVYACTFVRDDSLKGTIALMPLVQRGEGYPYNVAKIVKADER